MASLEDVLKTLAVGANLGGRALRGAFTEFRGVVRDHLSGWEPRRQALEAEESDAGVWEVRLDDEPGK